MNAHTLFLIRGTPGAGKSTFVKHLNAVAISSDDYNGPEPYMDDPSIIGGEVILNFRREWCLNETEKLMQDCKRNVAVHNVFSLEKYMLPYYELAKKYNYEVTCLIIENRHNNKSIWGMPEENVKELASQFEIKLTPELETIVYKNALINE